MKSNIKKAVSVLLALVIVLSAAPLSNAVRADISSPFTVKASAADAEENRFTYRCLEEGVYFISGEGTYPGYADPDSELYNFDIVVAVVFDDNVEAIGENAFKNCETLGTVYFGENIKHIGMNAFYGCTNLCETAFAGTEEQAAQIEIESGNEVLMAAETEYEYNEHGTLTDTISYRLNTISETLVISGTGDMPDLLDGTTPFININPKKIVIENGITSVGGGTFLKCNNVETIEIAGSVKTINYAAFFYCDNIGTVKIKNGVECIASCAFIACDINRLEIPASVTSMPSDSFEEPIDMNNPAYSSTVGEYSVDAENPNYSSEDGVLFNKDKTILFAYPAGNGNTYYSVPDGVQTIDTGSFELSRNLCEVYIPDSVKTIGWAAFESCESLSSVVIGDKVTDIGATAFHDCGNLKDVYFFGSDKAWKEIIIGENNDALLNAKLYTNISGMLSSTICYTFDDKTGTLTISGTGAMPDFASAEESPFAEKKYENVIIEEGVTSIGEYAFENSDISRLTIYNSMSSINDSAFNDCNPDMEIYYYCASENELINIGSDNDFKEENIHCFISYSVSENISAILDLYNGDLYINGNGDIPDYASAEESPFAEDIEYIKNIVIDWNISGIGSYAFANANADYLIVYNTVENIDANAFSGAKIDTVCFYDDTDNDSDTVNINPVGNECIKNAPHTQYYEFSNSTETAVIKGTGAIPDCGREYMHPLDLSGMKKIVIDDGITRIGAHAFDYCDPETIEISDTVTSIGEFALACSSESLKEITLGNSVKKIEDGAFRGLKNLKSVELPDSLTYIGNDAFAYSGLESIEIASNVIIGDGAFSGMNNLEKVIIKGAYVKFGDNVFADSPALKEVFIAADTVEYSEDCYNSFHTLNRDAFVVCTGDEFAADLKAASVNCMKYFEQFENNIFVTSFGETIAVDEDSDYQFIQYILEIYPDTEYVYFENLVLNGVDAADIGRSLRENITNQNGNLYLKKVYVFADVGGKALSFSDIRAAAEKGTLDSLIVTKLTDGESIIDILIRVFEFIKEYFSGILKKAANFVNKVIGIFRR